VPNESDPLITSLPPIKNSQYSTQTDIVSDANIEEDIEGTIEFKNVTFIYPDSGIKALNDISFKVHSGESLAIIGTTGSGKSTVANIICRMYDVDRGEVNIDGRPIKDYNISGLRSQIGYVPQDVFLFSDSIFNNIAFGSHSIDPDKVIQASKEADLYNNISEFQDGFNTKIGERGITLSGGQKQRVSIARAIVMDPRILIMDDSLSAVDTKTENTILNRMKKIMQGRTTIIISHRVSSAKLADKVIVLDDGILIEQGTNESLLKENGVYKSLYEKQLSSEEVPE